MSSTPFLDGLSSFWRRAPEHVSPITKNLNPCLALPKMTDTLVLSLATIAMPATSFIASHNVYDALFAADGMSDAASDTDTVSVVTVDSDAFAAPRLPTPTHEIVTSLGGCVRSTRDQRMKAKLREGVKTVFVHRLPPQTTVEELRVVFSPYGTIVEIYIPKFKDPSLASFGTNKSYAFIKFSSADDALLAFQSLFERLVLRSVRVRVTLSKNDQ